MQDSKIQALTLAAGYDSRGPKDLCRLLQVSSSFRRALQKEGGCHAIVDLVPALDEQPEKRMQRLDQFLQWLPQHAGLVQSIRLAVNGNGANEEATGFARYGLDLLMQRTVNVITALHWWHQRRQQQQ